MTPDKTDRRTERTRQALLAAFRELVLDHPYDTLAVGDIVERANVGRSTFYEHYDSKDALLSESVSGPFQTLAAIVGLTELPPALIGTVAHFRENQRVSRTLLGGPSADHPGRARGLALGGGPIGPDRELADGPACLQAGGDR